MRRRTFNRLMSWSPLAIAGWSSSSLKSPNAEIIQPEQLESGHRIGLIAPGSPCTSDQLERAVRNLRSLGLNPVLGEYINDKKGYLAGSDEARLNDLHDMFRRDDIHGIWCIRGGYGCTRLLPHIDYTLIRENPKVFVGFSDVTALHLAFFKYAGLVGFHAPVASSTWPDYVTKYLKKVLFDGDKVLLSSLKEVSGEDNETISYSIRSGQSEGRLLGGNLSILSSLAGTDYSPSYAHKVVFLEEVGEKPYRIDRMITQLLQATDLKRANGIVLGQFRDCEPEEDDQSLTLRQTLALCFGDLECPVSYGWNIGHIDDQFAVPIGVRARMDTEKQTIQLLETPCR